MRKDSAKNQFDVLIIGGGPAGSAAAISLTQLGYKTALVERSNYNEIRFGEAVPPEIKRLLIQLGVWVNFIEDMHFPSAGIQCVWGKDELYENNYILNPYGNGWHLDRLKFDTMMVKAAEDKDVYVLRGARVEQCFEDANGCWIINCITADQIYRLQSKFVVDASGRTSLIARKKNVRRISYDRLIGIVGLFSSESNKTLQKEIAMSKGFALIEAAENGWWYSAELPGSQIVVVYMTDADLYPHSSRLSAFYWRQQLNKTRLTKERANTNTTSERSHTLSVFSSRLSAFGGNNWLAIGDAAMSFDPLSSQGICKALDSGMNAAEVIHDKFTSNRHIPETFYRKKAEDFDKYLSSRTFYYRKEKRWCKSLFWQRRHTDVNVQLSRLIPET